MTDAELRSDAGVGPAGDCKRYAWGGGEVLPPSCVAVK